MNNHRILLSLLSLISYLLVLGAGCPVALPEQIPKDAVIETQQPPEEGAAGVPDDGLDEALQELDLVDTESSGGWGAY